LGFPCGNLTQLPDGFGALYASDDLKHGGSRRTRRVCGAGTNLIGGTMQVVGRADLRKDEGADVGNSELTADM